MQRLTPATSLPPRSRCSPRRHGLARGMTMLEIMIVIGIIALLIAISVPAIGHFKRAAKNSAVSEQLTGVGMALETYHDQFNVYPASSLFDATNAPTTAYGGAIGVGRAPAMLAEALTGYLPGMFDGAGDSGTSGTYALYKGESAFGFRTKGNAFGGNATGQVYGPYAAIKSLVSNNPTGTNPAPAVPDSDQSFVDAYGNEILYFRSTRSGNDNTGLPAVTKIFGTDPNANDYYFYADDNVTQPPRITGTRPTPINGGKAFFKLLGADGNNIGTTASTVLGAHSYLLLSPGPDGIPFNADDIVYRH